MPAAARGWGVGLLLVVWLLAAHPAGAENDAAVSPSPPPRQSAESNEDRPENAASESSAEAQARPAAKAPDRSPATPRKRKPFWPSEEIHVDKAVDFPADI